MVVTVVIEGLILWRASPLGGSRGQGELPHGLSPRCKHFPRARRVPQVRHVQGQVPRAGGGLRGRAPEPAGAGGPGAAHNSSE